MLGFWLFFKEGNPPNGTYVLDEQVVAMTLSEEARLIISL